MAVFVELDQVVGHVDDRARRPVVVFQANHFGIRPVFLKAQNVLDFGPTPTVNRLIIIANDTDVAVFSRQRLDDPVLAGVGILVFVDQQMVKPGSLRALRTVSCS